MKAEHSPTIQRWPFQTCMLPVGLREGCGFDAPELHFLPGQQATVEMRVLKLDTSAQCGCVVERRGMVAKVHLFCFLALPGSSEQKLH